MEFHRPNNIYDEQKNIEDDKLKAEFFTVLGQEQTMLDGKPCRIQEDDMVYAKRTQKKDGSYRNFIKLSSNGKLYNPVSVYGGEKTNNFLDRVCRSNDKFKAVNDKAFNWYVQFLSSKNLAWLHNAEREID